MYIGGAREARIGDILTEKILARKARLGDVLTEKTSFKVD